MERWSEIAKLRNRKRKKLPAKSKRPRAKGNYKSMKKILLPLVYTFKTIGRRGDLVKGRRCDGATERRNDGTTERWSEIAKLQNRKRKSCLLKAKGQWQMAKKNNNT